MHVYMYIGCAFVLSLARHDLPRQVHRSLRQGVQVSLMCICGIYMYTKISVKFDLLIMYTNTVYIIIFEY